MTGSIVKTTPAASGATIRWTITPPVSADRGKDGVDGRRHGVDVVAGDIEDRCVRARPGGGRTVFVARRRSDGDGAPAVLARHLDGRRCDTRRRRARRGVEHHAGWNRQPSGQQRGQTGRLAAVVCGRGGQRDSFDGSHGVIVPPHRSAAASVVVRTFLGVHAPSAAADDDAAPSFVINARRESTPSRRYTCWRWVSTVRSLRKSRRATSAFDSPATTRSTTSASRRVSSPTPPRRPPIRTPRRARQPPRAVGPVVESLGVEVRHQLDHGGTRRRIGALRRELGPLQPGLCRETCEPEALERRWRCRRGHPSPRGADVWARA